MKRSVKYISQATIGAIFLLIIDVVIKPGGLSANNGISYYGIYLSTIIPYSIAFLTLSAGYWLTSEYLGDSYNYLRLIKVFLKIMAILFIGILVTPYTYLSFLHEFIGTILFVLQLLLSIWFIILLSPNWKNVGLFIIELSMGIAAFYYLPKQNGLLFQTQVIFQISFSVLLLMILNRDPIKINTKFLNKY